MLAVSAACLILTISAAPQTLPVLYDSSIKISLPKVSSSELSGVYNGLLRVASTDLKRDCGASKLSVVPKLAGLARGSFTRKGLGQVAWLFEVCEMDDGGFYGLVIVENGRTVRVSSLKLTELYALANELYSIRDINSNGVDELALLWVSGDGGYLTGAVVLLEQSAQQLAALGQLYVFQMYSEDTGRSTESFDWKVFVLKGNPPAFIGTPRIDKGSPVKLTLDKPQLSLQNFLVR